ncbi:MAG TPA: peptidylprolyl isomerase [Bryobacteraceae bacterium]|jgi:parvulin-like peptidyl-prolyl isomerase|nr:peptidylprolyl isomerase [Bryobacteraceae bacterium]
MSSNIGLIGVALLGTLVPAGTLPAADRTDPQVRVVEEIVAKVNSDIVTRGELAKQRAEVEAALRQQGLTGDALQTAVNTRFADVLRDQIDQLLLVQKGKELNINVDSDVNRRLAEIQSESKIADPEKFHDWVHEGTGETFEDFKLQMHNQLLTQRVLSEEVWRNITIPRAEMQKYYDEHKKDFIREDVVLLRDILVSTGDNSPDKVAAAEKKARGLADRARKGEKFTDLARQNSDGPTAANDGELGSFKKGQLRKEVETVVFTHDKGYVTDPIKTPAGFEIYRVEERYSAGQATFDEVEAQINSIMAEPRGGVKVRDYLTQLRTNAFLQIKTGYTDSGAAKGKDTTWKDPTQLRPETTTKEAVAASKRKKLLKVIPYGHVGGKSPDVSPAPPPTVTPVPSLPVPVPPQ